MCADHRRAIAAVQASRRDVLVECERALVRIQQELRLRDQAGAEIERRILDVIEEAKERKASAERVAPPAPPASPAIAAIDTAAEDAIPQQLMDVEAPLPPVFDAADDR